MHISLGELLGIVITLVLAYFYNQEARFKCLMKIEELILLLENLGDVSNWEQKKKSVLTKSVTSSEGLREFEDSFCEWYRNYLWGIFPEGSFAHSYLRKPLLLYIFDIIQHRPFLHDDWKYYERVGYLRLCFVVYLKKHYRLAIQMSPVYYETLPSGLRPFIEQNMRIFIEKINNTEIFYNNPIDYNEITEELNKTVYELTGCK
jgi:hypothetical protein